MANVKSTKWADRSGRAVVIHPYQVSRVKSNRPNLRMVEACGLASAIGLKVVGQNLIALRRPNSSTLVGSGWIAMIASHVKKFDVEVVIIDGTVTPVQQRNLENAWNSKVIDRTGLILEIFAARARTKEGRLQVELAQLTYQRSRLVRHWTHLERQRGGLGNVGGPGETQIESDRRIIEEKVVKIRRQITEVIRTRQLQRKKRRDEPFPIVALVGYTNAGKSTIFNRLTGSRVVAEDMLFATLDPTMRSMHLPSGQTIIISDTVGFISDLPNDLVAAFRATFEEILEADVILHVRDVTHENNEAQKEDVNIVMRKLGVDQLDNGLVIEVFNKIDLADDVMSNRAAKYVNRVANCVAVSGLKGKGINTLIKMLDQKINQEKEILNLRIDPIDGKTLAWLYRRGEVVKRIDTESFIDLTVRLDARFAAQVGMSENQFNCRINSKIVLK